MNVSFISSASVCHSLHVLVSVSCSVSLTASCSTSLCTVVGWSKQLACFCCENVQSDLTLTHAVSSSSTGSSRSKFWNFIVTILLHWLDTALAAVRPHNKCLLVLSLCWHWTSNLTDGRVVPCQKYIRGFVWRKTDKIHSRHFTHPPLTFTVVKMCKTWPHFLTPVAFEALWFQNEAIYQKSKTLIRNAHNWTVCWVRILPISPVIFRASQSAKFVFCVSFNVSEM